MKLLFENGADATALDAEGDTMLENAATPKRLYNGKINHDLQVHARKVVQYLAEDIGLPVTDKVMSLAESDPDTLAVCREARRKPRRLESLARLVVWKSHKMEDIPKMMGWDHIPEGSSAEELLRKIVYFK